MEIHNRRMTGTPLPTAMRPLSFDTVIGHEAAISQLSAMIRSQTMSHVIFVGLSGVGKTTLARILAKNLNCVERSGAHPCGQCASCRSIDEGGRHRAYHELNAASRDGSKEELSDFLQHDISAVPPGYRHHVVFVDEAQRLSTYSQDLLLKSLEEQHGRTIFIFALIDEGPLSEAFQARCRVIRLHPPTVEQRLLALQRACLEATIGAEQDALVLIAERSPSIRRALSRLEQVRDATEDGDRISVELARLTLFREESDATIALLKSALAGDTTSAAVAIDQMGSDPSAAILSIQRLLTLIKVTQIGPHFGHPSRAEMLLYDHAAIAALVEAIVRTAKNLNHSAYSFYDMLLEHWSFTPPPTSEALRLHALRFVDLCAATGSCNEPSRKLGLLPTISEPYRSSRLRRPRATRYRPQSTAARPDQFLSSAQAAQVYEAATFLVQEFGIALNAALKINFIEFGIASEESAASLLTNLSREMAQRLRGRTGSAHTGPGLHRLSLLGRDATGNITGSLVFHLPAGTDIQGWLNSYFGRFAHNQPGINDLPELDFRAPVDPRNALDRQWSLLRRYIWAGLDPALLIQNVPLIDHLAVANRQRHPAGAVERARLRFSHSIGRKGQTGAAAEGMAHLSAWHAGRWDQLFTGWELQEHRERVRLRERRCEALTLFEARRAVTGDPLALSVIDKLEHDERTSWAKDPLNRPRTRPFWTARSPKSGTGN